MHPVVVYLQPGTVSQSRQAADCLAHCNLRRYRIVAVVRPDGPCSAVAAVTGGWAALIVTAYSPRARTGDLRDLAAQAGVTVEYVRVPVLRREVAQLIARMYQRSGHNVRAVADQLGVTSQEIRLTLDRISEPPDSPKRVGRRHDGR